MLLLASASPRRKELLTNAGFEFQVFSVPVPEDARQGESAETLARRLAAAKASAAYAAALSQFSPVDLTVLGADTVVSVDHHVLGKPVDAEDAARMLRLLSGRTHQVVTAVSIVSPEGQQTAAETTQVTFFSLNDEEIKAYVRSGEPMDKAGSYAIQGYASRWVPSVKGCYFNVVGLPIALVASMLQK